MKAMLCLRPGGPDDLQLQDISEPTARDGEAVVKVAAAALNFFDTLIVAGKYQTKPAFPFSPGAEFSGTIESAKGALPGFAVGDRVMGFIGYGAARERVAAPSTRLVRLPDRLDFDRAAGLSVTYGTTYYALKDRAQLKPGETLAVLGAAGGTGLAAIELGKIMGARVIACASSGEKLDFARKHGADDVINYADQDLKETLKNLTAGNGVDVVYDPVGGAFTEAALRATARNGRLLVIGFAAGEIPKIPLNLVLLKNCSIVGVHWGGWIDHALDMHQANMRQIVDWAAVGKLSSHVHAVYPLAQTAQALKDIASRKVMGKIVLHP